MSATSSTRSPRVRSSGEKLYQACLDSIITGLENFPVDKRQRGSGSATAEVHSTTTNSPSDALGHSPTPRAITPSPYRQPIIEPLSPPPTPTRANQSPPPHSSAQSAAMNRAPLHGAPPRGARGSFRGTIPPYSPQDARGGRGATPSYGLLDARSSQGSPSPYGSQTARGTSSALNTQQASGSFAVQPVANAGSMKLKKNAVKIVSATTPSETAPPTAASSPAPQPVKAMPKEVESYQPAEPLARGPSISSSPSPMATEVKLGKPSMSQESALEDLFARLNAEAISTEDVIKKEPLDSPPISHFVFEDITNKAKVSPVPKPDVNLISAVAAKWAQFAPKEPKFDTPAVTPEEIKDMSKAELEQLYLRKAYDYLQALPTSSNVSVQVLKTVSKKLRSSYAPSNGLSTVEVEKLQARYAFAIVNYVKNSDKGAKPITTDTAKYILRETNGDMLRFFSKLVDLENMSLADIDNSVGLCKTLLDVLPKAETAPTPVVLEVKPAVVTSTSATEAAAEPSAASTVDLQGHVSKDPVDSLKAWPTQENRENPAQHRACILTGVSGVKNINELQALVWGGRLESIQLPSPGSDFAVVRFLTPEACDKYFNATENGIELGGMNKTVIFVEKQPGPSSINDVVRNCTEGDASRCVRALDAEEDWSDMMLMKLARGKGQIKREIDRIKQGKTARGRHYIEFRFATIYHALNFKRQLMEDPEWEPCTIGFATDPCETAQGVHYKDSDE